MAALRWLVPIIVVLLLEPKLSVPLFALLVLLIVVIGASGIVFLGSAIGCALNAVRWFDCCKPSSCRVMGDIFWTLSWAALLTGIPAILLGGDGFLWTFLTVADMFVVGWLFRNGCTPPPFLSWPPSRCTPP